MSVRLTAAILLLACAVPGRAEAAPGHDPGVEFRVKPSELPASAPGESRRVIQAFGEWTLVCDENLRRKQRVCNVSQQIVDRQGEQVFSWSLAATREGAPVMIVRAPSEGQDVRTVQVAFPKLEPVDVVLATCNETLCLGFLAVDAGIGRALRAGGNAVVTVLRQGRTVTLNAPIGNLAQALKALR